MVPAREKPKRISWRPMLRLFLVFGAVAILYGSGARWRMGAFLLIGVLAVVAIIARFLGRRVASARKPDPQSTLKI